MGWGKSPRTHNPLGVNQRVSKRQQSKKEEDDRSVKGGESKSRMKQKPLHSAGTSARRWRPWEIIHLQGGGLRFSQEEHASKAETAAVSGEIEKRKNKKGLLQGTF